LLTGTITADISTVTGQQYDQTAMIGYGDQDDFAQAICTPITLPSNKKRPSGASRYWFWLTRSCDSFDFIYSFFIHRKRTQYEDNSFTFGLVFNVPRNFHTPPSDLSSSSCVAVFQEEKERTMMFNQLQNRD
jgi:hypothetical protein